MPILLEFQSDPHSHHNLLKTKEGKKKPSQLYIKTQICTEFFFWFKKINNFCSSSKFAPH